MQKEESSAICVLEGSEKQDRRKMGRYAGSEYQHKDFEPLPGDNWRYLDCTVIVISNFYEGEYGFRVKEKGR